MSYVEEIWKEDVGLLRWSGVIFHFYMTLSLILNLFDDFFFQSYDVI